MKGLLPTFVLVIAMSVSAVAQDSTMPAQSGTAQNSTMAQQGDASMPQPGSTNALHTYVRTRFQHCLSLLVRQWVQRRSAPLRCTFSGQS